jgi:hypothetical protein
MPFDKFMAGREIGSGTISTSRGSRRAVKSEISLHPKMGQEIIGCLVGIIGSSFINS